MSIKSNKESDVLFFVAGTTFHAAAEMMSVTPRPHNTNDTIT